MNLIGRYVSPYLKAHIGGFAAAVALLCRDLAALKSGGHLSLTEWSGILGAYVGVGGLVGLTPNQPSTPAVAVDANASVVDTGDPLLTVGGILP